MTNTVRHVGTATGVAVFGALYASRVTSATLRAHAGLPTPPGTVQRLAAALGSGVGARVAVVVLPVVGTEVTHAAHATTASGLDDVLLSASPTDPIQPGTPRPTDSVGAIETHNHGALGG